MRVHSFIAASLAAALAYFIAASTMPCAAEAQTQHTVRQGQNLARISRRYHVPVYALASANHLAPDAELQPGQILVIPSAGEVYVRRRQSLRDIASEHGVDVAELARANRLQPTSPLRAGQRLVLPGAAAEGARPGARPAGWGAPRHPGIVNIKTSVGGRNRQLRLRLLDRRGRVPREAITRMAALMRPPETRTRLSPDPRLLKLLARVSNHFGGRTLHMASGVRRAGGYTSDHSRHVTGHAFDFSVEGVPNTTLRDYCRTFDDVGVGYYPRSTFVHLDVRERSAYWVDWSRRGEAPRYARPGEPAPSDGTADEPAETNRDEDEARADSDPALEAGGADAPAAAP